MRKLTFTNIGCADAFDVAFDYMAIVEKIQTWNLSNELNVIDSKPVMTKMTDEERSKVSFDVPKDQSFLKTEGQIRLGDNRRVLVFNKSYVGDTFREGYRIWKIQGKNKNDEWYNSDTITIKTRIDSLKSSCYTLIIESNSRDIADQIIKEKFPKKYGAPALFKLSKSDKKDEIEVDVIAIEKHRWQVQDDLIDLGATFSGSGKVLITIPIEDNEGSIKQLLSTLRGIYGFDSKVSQDDSSYYIETSDYVFNKTGLKRFDEQSRGK